MKRLLHYAPVIQQFLVCSIKLVTKVMLYVCTQVQKMHFTQPQAISFKQFKDREGINL